MLEDETCFSNYNHHAINKLKISETNLTGLVSKKDSFAIIAKTLEHKQG